MTILKTLIATSLIAATLSGCAASPDTIAPVYVSPVAYADYTCHTLNVEAQAIAAQLASLTGQQTAAANNDAALTAVSLILFWPAAFFIAGGNDYTPEIAELRGRADAIYAAAIEKGCNG